MSGFCLHCLVEIPRDPPPLDAGILDVGGWQIQCPKCGCSLWISLDEDKPIEYSVVPFGGDEDWEPGAIFFNDEKKLLEAAVKGEI